MPSKIILKKSSVAAKVPVAGDLDFGELALNYTDSKLYFKKANGSIDSFSTLSGVTSVDGNTGAITATQLLTSIKTVDGAGSGLDADTLDGLDSSSFLTLSGTETFTNKTMKNSTLEAYQEKVQAVGTVSTSTYNIDLNLANIFDITLGSNVTFTFTNPPTSNFSKPTTIILRQDSTGNRTATFTNAKYTDGALPQLSTGVNQIDVLTFFTINGGSFWFGTFAMANVS